MFGMETRIVFFLALSFGLGFYGVLTLVRAYLNRHAPRPKPSGDDGVYDYAYHQTTEELFTGGVFILLSVLLLSWALHQLGVI